MSEKNIDLIISHHGIKGQKWGIRRYQNEDGTLTEVGEDRYYDDNDNEDSHKENNKKTNATKKVLIGSAVVGGLLIGGFLAKRSLESKVELRSKNLSNENFNSETFTDNTKKEIEEGKKALTRVKVSSIGTFKKNEGATNLITLEDTKKYKDNLLVRESSKDLDKEFLDRIKTATGKNSIYTGKNDLIRLEDTKNFNIDVMNKKNVLKKDMPMIVDREAKDLARRTGMTFSSAKRYIFDIIGVNQSKLKHSCYYDYLMHHGIKGQKWGIRRYQYEDGSLTPDGIRRYNNNTSIKEIQYRNADYYKEKALSNYNAAKLAEKKKDYESAKKLEKLGNKNAKLAEKMEKRADKLSKKPIGNKTINELKDESSARTLGITAVGVALAGLHYAKKYSGKSKAIIGEDGSEKIVKGFRANLLDTSDSHNMIKSWGRVIVGTALLGYLFNRKAKSKSESKMEKQLNNIKHSEDIKEKIDYLMHHGIKGQKWGIRRYQNEDGTLTDSGKARYNQNGEKMNAKNATDSELNKANQRLNAEKQYDILTGNYSKHVATSKDTYIRAMSSLVASSLLTIGAAYGAIQYKDKIKGYSNGEKPLYDDTTGELTERGKKATKAALMLAAGAGLTATITSLAKSFGGEAKNLKEDIEKIE